MMKTNYDVAIIGSGPAGITSAIYLRRAGFSVVIIEKDAPGGQILKTSVVENYPGFEKIDGPSLALKFYEQVQKMDVVYKFGEVIEIVDKKSQKIIKLKDEMLKVKAVILAVGRKPKNLGDTSLDGKGVSYCSLCDGYLYKNEEVAIVGGGNSALEEAIYLAEICKKVTIINRSENLRGDDILVKRIKSLKNIKILYNSEIESFNKKEDVLYSLNIKCKGKIEELKVKACFIFIGYEPATDFLKNLDILDDYGYIEVDEKMQTKIEGIYAAGDVVKKDAYQIVTATSDGALAAVSCVKYLN